MSAYAATRIIHARPDSAKNEDRQRGVSGENSTIRSQPCYCAASRTTNRANGADEESWNDNVSAFRLYRDVRSNASSSRPSVSIPVGQNILVVPRPSNLRFSESASKTPNIPLQPAIPLKRPSVENSRWGRAFRPVTSTVAPFKSSNAHEVPPSRPTFARAPDG